MSSMEGMKGRRFGIVLLGLAAVIVGGVPMHRVDAQCASGSQLYPLTVSQWGDTSTNPENCNQVYIQRTWDRRNLNTEVGGETFPPVGWFDIDFDDSSWDTGVLPFGGNVGCAAQLSSAVPGFPNIGVANTVWNVDTNTNANINSFLAVRLKFFLSPNLFFRTEEFQLNFIADNDIKEMYLNGVSQTFTAAPSGNGCGRLSQFVPNNLDSSVLVPETNVIALLAEDRGSRSYLNYQLVVQVCDLSPTTNFTCSLTSPPAQPCMHPCSSDGSQCELVPSCLLEGLVADENGSCLCELVDDIVCPSVDALILPGVCYPKETRQVLRLLSCDTRTDICRA